MATIWAALFFLLLAVAQVTVAPRYPLSAAFPDYVLVALSVWVISRQQEDSMVALPLAAVLTGVLGPQSVMVLVFVYLAMLPAGLAIRALSPLGAFVNVTVLLIGATLLRDMALAAQAVAGGANIGPADFLFHAFFPGLALNLLMMPFFYFFIRYLGPQMSFAQLLQRRAW